MFPKRRFKKRADPVLRAPLSLFEALEPRLLLSGDPLGLHQGDSALAHLLPGRAADLPETADDAQFLFPEPGPASLATPDDTPPSPLVSPSPFDLSTLSGLPDAGKRSDESSQSSQTGTGPAPSPTASTGDSADPVRHELSIVDPDTPDYETLIRQLQSEDGRIIDVAVLDGSRDGIVQIGELLSGHEQMDAVHIVSHGIEGGLQLGATWLTLDRLEAERDAIAGWGGHLSPDADLLLYGCNLAGNDQGTALVRSLAQFTGADVAASTDPTGNTRLGGDWVLEHARGEIETDTAFPVPLQQAWSFLLSGAPPAVALVNGTLTYTENSGPVAVDATLTVTDGDDTDLAGAAATVSAGFVSGEDFLDFDAALATGFGIAGSYDAGTGVLTFTGTASVANYEAVLQTVTYENPSHTPTTASRWVTVAADDGTGTGSDDRRINIADVNDPPQIDLDGDDSSAAGTGFVANYSVGGNPVRIADSDATLADLDTATLSSLTMEFSSGRSDGNNEILAADTTGTAITANWNGGPGRLTLSGVDTLAHYVQVLRTVTYENIEPSPTVTPPRTVTFEADDGTDKSNIATATVHVQKHTGLWVSTTGDVAASGIPELPAWFKSDVLQIGDPSLSFEPGVTDGTFSKVFDVPSTNVLGLHFVSRDITVGSGVNTVSLSYGDVLFTIQANNVTLGGTSGLDKFDVIAFHPNSPSDYSGGTYELVLERPLNTNTQLRGVSLVEQDTSVGNTVLEAGTFLLLQGQGGSNDMIVQYTADTAGSTSVGKTTSGTIKDVVDTSALGFDTLIAGIDLVQGNAVVGGTTLTEGQLLLGTANADISAPLLTTPEDIYLLTLTNTELGSGTAGSVALFFDGSEIGWESPGEEADGISLLRSEGAPVFNPAVNIAPTTASVEGTALAYTEDDGPTAITGTLTVGDADSSLVTGATAVITAGDAPGEDVLAFTDTGSISGSWDGATGILTLTGNDTPGNYELALRAITYENTSDAPDTTNRSVRFLVDDGTDWSNASTRDITVAARNDAPAVGNATLTAVDEDTAAPSGDTVNNLFGAGFSDPDSGAAFGGIAVVSNPENASEGTWEYTTDGNWLPIGSVGDDATALALSAATQVRFVPAGNYYGTPTGLGVRALDDTHAGYSDTTGGTETRVNVDTGTNGDPTAIAAATATLGTSVTPVGDTPTAANIITDEDTPSGAIVLGRNADDGVEVTHFHISNISGGSLYQNDGTTLINDGDYITFAQGDAGLKFTPTADSNATGSFDVESSEDGTSVALQSGAATSTITVTPVNDAPSGADKTVDTDEDTDHVFVTGDFGFTDPVEGHGFDAIVIDSLPAAGTLTLGGVAVTLGQTVPEADITAGDLVFAPAPETSGNGYASFDFRVRDDGGTGNGGDDTASSPNTITIDVTAVNDAPAIANLAGDHQVYLEGSGAVLIDQGGDAGVSDPDSANLDTGNLTVSIVSGGAPTEDVLSIRDQGTAAGEIGFDGTTVTYGGVSIGTAAGGSGGAALVVTFNTDATPDAVGALVRNITYEDTETELPTLGTLTVRFTVSDGADTSSNNDATIEVRETAPGGVRNGLTLWLKADAGVTQAGTVSQWDNQTPNLTLPDVHRADVDQQPAYVSSAVNFNPVLAFDGVDDDLHDTSVWGLDLFKNSAATLFVMANNVNSPGVAVQWLDSGSNRVSLEGNAPRFDFGDQVADRLDGTGSATAGYHIVTAQTTSTGPSANQALYIDGALDNQANASAANPLSANHIGSFRLGEYPLGGFQRQMDLGEVIIYRDDLSAAERSKVDSYLAVKYGLTLDQSSPTDYVASDGTVIRDAGASPGYGNDIAGIGRDDASALDQSQSRSINADSIVTVSAAADQDDGEFLLWGNDDGALSETTTSLPAGVLQRLDRTWVVEETGDVGDTTLTFDLSSVVVTGSQDSDFYLIVDSDTDFTSGATTVAAAGFAGNVVTFNNVDLSDGQFFTLGTDANAVPGATNANTAEGYTEDVNLDLTDIVVTDPDSANVTVTLTLSDVAAGNLSTATSNAVTSTFAGGVWTASGAKADVNTLLAGVEFQPSAHYNGDFSIAVALDDGTSAGTPGVKPMTGTGVNDEPAGTDDILTLVEDTPYTLTVADFGFSDPVEGDALDAVRITTLPGSGTLTLSGSALSAGDFVPFGDITGGNLRFTPGADDNGAGYTSFTFQVRDDGGTGNGGLDTDQTPNTLTIDVTPVGDTPTAASIVTPEDTQSAAILLSRHASDGAEVTHFRISNITGGTPHRNDGTTVINDGDYITFAEGQAGLKFTPTLNSNTAGSFDAESSEDGSTVASQSGAATSTITITPVGDTPTAASIVTTEDAQSADIVLGRNASDGTEVTHFRISNISGGTLYRNDGTTVISDGDYITFLEGSTGLKFTPSSNSNAAGSFDVESSEDGSTVAAQSGIATSTIAIAPVGDTPTAAGIVTTEDTQSAAIVLGRNASDGTEVTHFRISNISGGTLYQSDGTTVISDGDYITFAEGQAGLKFTPTLNSNTAGGFDVESSEDGSTVAAQSGVATSTIAIAPVGDTPTAASIVTIEDTQSAAIVLGRHAADGAEVTHFRISNITGGTLYRNDGATVISDGNYITFAEGQAGLKFTPTLNSNAAGSFDVESSEDGSTVAAQSGIATPTITIAPVGDTPTAAGIVTTEDTQSGAIVLGRNASDGAEVTHFRISNISGGTLYRNDGTTVINDGDYITFLEGSTGLKFTPNANSNSAGSFDVESSEDGSTVAAQSDVATSTITITPIGDTPTVASVVTTEDNQSGTIVLGRNANDGAEVTHFRISNITGGLLYQDNGTTVINDGDYITFAQGSTGLRFTPTSNSNSPGSFDVESSEDGSTVAAQSGAATSTISITPVGDTPTAASIDTTEDTQSGPIILGRNANDGAEITHFRISNISGGTLYRNDGTTVISDGDYVAFAEGDAGLKFTPTANSNAAGSFDVESSEDGSTVAAQSGRATTTITITPVGDTPTVASVVTPEDTQSTAIVLGRNANDGAEVTHFRISNVTGGTLYRNDGTTVISDGDYITFLGGSTGLKFTPTANSNAAGSFDVESSEDGSTVAAQSSAATSTITITPVGDTPTTASIVTNEDTQSAAIVIGRNANDSAEVTHFRISNITGGTLYRNDGTTVISDGDYITILEGSTGLKFTPSSNSNAAGSFDVEASEDGSSVAAQSGTATSTITVTPVGDTPTVANLTTFQNVPSNPIVIDRHADDGTEVTHFRISGISNGSLSLADGTTPVNDGDYVTYLEGQAGLRFTPAFNSLLPGSFDVESSEDGSSVAAQSGVVTSTITVNPVNTPPSGSDNTISLLEDGVYAFSASDFGFSDVVDGNALSGVVVTTLPVSGTLNLAGVSVSAGQTVTATDISAGDLTYSPVADEHGTGYAAFTFQVRDDGGTANGGVDTDATPNTLTLDITPVGDTPTAASVVTLEDNQSAAIVLGRNPGDGAEVTHFRISNITGGTLYRNDGASLISDGDYITFAEGDAGLKFTPTSDSNTPGSFDVESSEDGSTVAGQSGIATSTITVTPVGDTPTVANITTFMDVQSNPIVIDRHAADGPEVTHFRVSGINNGTLYRNDGTTVINDGDYISYAQGQAGLRFTPTPGSLLPGSFDVESSEDGATVAVQSGVVTSTITVNPVNTPPSGSDNTVSLLEDGVYTFSPADFGFSDPTDGNALSGVVLTTLPASGTLALAGVAVTAGQTVTTAALGAGDLTFIPAPDANGAGYAGFSFQVRDDGGTANGGVDIDPTPNALTLDVTPVNDAPTLSLTGHQGVNEDAGPHHVPGFATALPGGGADELTQALAFTVSHDNPSLFAVAPDIDAAGNLTYTLAAHANGSATVTVSVSDSGGTANDGVNTGPARAFDIVVAPVNDPPAGTDRTLSLPEDTPYTFEAADFGFSDAVEGDTLAAVRITTLPGAGSLTLAGAPIQAGDSITAAELAAGRLAFSPDPDANGSGYAGFTFQVQDDGGVANGGLDTDPTPNRLTMDITPVNDAPTLSLAGHQGVNEDAGPHHVPGFATALPGGGADELTQALAFTVSNDNPSLFAVAPDIDAAGNLTYTLAAHANGSATVTVSVSDSGGAANGGVDTGPARAFDIVVAPVNDPPAGTDRTLSLPEDTPYTFEAADFGFSDAVEGDTLAAVRITTLPGAGTLTLNGAPIRAGDAIAAADIAAGRLVFAPAPDANGSGYAGFTFQVRDDGGAANGGIDTDPVPNTLNMDVDPVNDAPTDLRLDGTTVAEGTDTSNGFPVGTVSASDRDLGDTLSFSVSGGADARYFTIGGATGDMLVLTHGILDFDLKPNYRVTITVTDAGGLSDAIDTIIGVRAEDILMGEPIETESAEAAPNELPEPEIQPVVVVDNDSDAQAPETKTSESEASDEDEAEQEVPLVDIPPVQEGPQILVDDSDPPSVADNSVSLLRALLNGVPTGLVSLSVPDKAPLEPTDPTEGYLSLEDLESPAELEGFMREIDQLREDVEDDIKFEQVIVGSTVAVSASLSVGYVMWLVRGGMLLSSVLTSLPAWQFVDPLPVLAHTRRDDDVPDDDESLESMIKESEYPADSEDEPLEKDEG